MRHARKLWESGISLTRRRNIDEPGFTKIQHRYTKQSTYMTLVKRDHLFINKEEERQKTIPDAAVALFIILLLYYKPCNIQDMIVWLQQFSAGIYQRWALGATTTPYY